MDVISSPSIPPIPPEVAGINVNFCKNPRCENFGVPASIVRWRRKVGSALATTPGTAYDLVSRGKSRPSLKCLLCGEHFSIKSNLAVAEEVMRFADYLTPPEEPHCPKPACPNHVVPVTTESAYYRFGLTNAGAKRWRCRRCSTTFSVGGPATRRQRVTHLNKAVLMSLTNKMPLRRIMKVTGMNGVTLYGKINFLYRQSLTFAASRERALLDMELDRLYISVDRQEYMVNWARDTDRRNVVLRAVGSCDNPSGYVFGAHLAFDPTMDPAAVEVDAAALKDTELPYPHRRYARLWLKKDYDEALVDAEKERDRTAAKNKKGPTKGDLTASIEDSYEAAAIRDDSEVSGSKDETQKLSETRGTQVHEEYSLYGHFMFLKGLLRSVGKLRFFLDQDSGMRAACLAAFARDVKSRRVDAFYVRIAKDMTVDKKRASVTRARKAVRQYEEAFPELKPDEIVLELMKAEIARAVTLGAWSDRWCAHPYPNMSEADKALCWLTDLEGYDDNHKARLFLKGSLHGIDNFFQRVRRSLNPLERPHQTASKAHRAWYGYSPYNPALVEKLLGIYRVMHNFVEVGKDGKTPAMRLGLAHAAVKPEDIIYHT